VGQRSI